MSDDPKDGDKTETTAQSSGGLPEIPQPDPGCRMENREFHTFANERPTKEDLDQLDEATGGKDE